jgi:alpha-mannosidase
VAIDATYTWPERVVDEGRVGERTVAVHTELELQAGDDLVRVSEWFDNPCRDHRLRAWFPLPQPTDRSRAECAFAIVERGLEAEGGPSERGLPTFPSRRFVQAGGLTVVHDGLLEYELVDVSGGEARALALTLLRCTGMLSQGPMAYRPLPAGPTTPMEGPQMIGPQHLRYAVHVGDADPYALVDDAFVPLRTLAAPGTGTLVAEGQALAVEGAEVSAVVREGGALSVRLFNPTSETATVTIEGHSGWLVDLAGQPVAAFEGRFALAPGALTTARLT